MKAETAKAAADTRKRQIRNIEQRTLELRRASQKFWEDRIPEHEVEQNTNTAASKDPLWKGHVSDNQWYMQQATMYGTAANNDLLIKLIAVLGDTVMAIRHRG